MTARAPVIAVTGPTAAGKSALSIALAHLMNGEIVNCDSMQLYRGMDIGTAKLTVTEREGVPHHLLDIWSVTQTASVADYQVLARAVIDDIYARGKTPMLVGGSGLYVRAVLDDFEFPGTSPVVRAELEAELELAGSGALHDRLRGLDPVAADKILPSNGRKIVRALEVITITGRPFTASLPSPIPVYPYIAVAVDRTDLDVRVEQRVKDMWAAGLVDEVRALEQQGLRDGQTARRALGYQQVLAYLAGECTQDEALMATVFGTRRFVRRQRSWWRRDASLHWLDGAAPNLVEQALGVVR